jgi:tetratricopeptide (TPR) repeat protein
MRKLSFVLLLLGCSLSSMGQEGAVDSLSKVLRSAQPDTARVSTLLALSSEFYRTDAGKARELAQEARDLAERIDHKSGLAKAYKAMGMTYYFQNNWVDCLVQWKLALETFQAIKDLNGVSNMLNNIGATHFAGGDDKAALDYYLQSLRVAEEY